MLTGSITVRRRGKQEGGRGGGHGKGSRREGGTKEENEEELVSFQWLCVDACQRPPPPNIPQPPHSHELKAVCVCHCHPERSKPSAGTKDRHKIKVWLITHTRSHRGEVMAAKWNEWEAGGWNSRWRGLCELVILVKPWKIKPFFSRLH